MPVNMVKNTVKNLVIPRELAAAVTDFRFANRLKADADAYRFLIQRGLDAEKKDRPAGQRRRKDDPPPEK